MNNLQNFNNKIIICPKNEEKALLKEINKSNFLFNIKFMSIEAFYSSLTFEISNEIIFFVMKLMDIEYDVAKTYLQSLKDIYLFDEIDNEKVQFLLNLKKELIKNEFIKEKTILKYYNTQNFIVYGYNFIENKYKKALEKLKSCEIISFASFPKKKMVVFEFETIEDEINYVFEQIFKLLNDGIDINNIKLSGINKDYCFLIKKYSKMYHLPIEIRDQKSIYSTEIGKKFIDSIKNNTYLNYLEELKIKNVRIYGIIVNVLNEFSFVNNYNEALNMIIQKFKSTYINENTIDDIKVIDFEKDVINDDDFVFILGINQGKIPHIVKDEDYLNDEIKEKIGLSTTVDVNKANKEYIINKLYSFSNCFLSFSKSSTFSSLLKSSLIDECGIEVKKGPKKELKYSNEYNKYLLTCKLDDYIKYGITDEELNRLFATYQDNNYDKYDNKFKGISPQKMQRKLNNQVSLSFSSLDTFQECKFQYYISKILKLDIYEETFYTSLGTLFHEVLKVAFEENFDFEKCYENTKNELFKEISKKDEFFISNLKKELVFIIDVLKEQLNEVNYDQILTEKEVKLTINDGCCIRFTGIIDKIMYKEEDGITYVAVIDYKTGNIDPTVNECKYGLHLQLPIYIILSKYTGLKNVKVTGFYYQTLIPSILKAESEEEYIKAKKDYLKLRGYTLDRNSSGLTFDKHEESSNVIRSLSITKDGKYGQRSKVLSQNEMNNLEKLVESKIKQAGNSILNGDFAINPIMIENENYSCKYCKYRDLCFRQDKDITKHEKVEDLSFLGEYE